MSNQVDKEVFELHMENINKNISKLYNLVEKLFEKQEDMNVTLTKNTVVVNEHHQRSTKLEGVVASLTDKLQSIEARVKSLDNEVKHIDGDIKPIKVHVEKMNRLTGFLDGVPFTIKMIVALFTIASSIFGIIQVIKELNIK
jgi:t-SNARE complex subunit (syntaxin)